MSRSLMQKVLIGMCWCIDHALNNEAVDWTVYQGKSLCQSFQHGIWIFQGVKQRKENGPACPVGDESQWFGQKAWVQRVQKYIFLFRVRKHKLTALYFDSTMMLVLLCQTGDLNVALCHCYREVHYSWQVTNSWDAISLVRLRCSWGSLQYGIKGALNPASAAPGIIRVASPQAHWLPPEYSGFLSTCHCH